MSECFASKALATFSCSLPRDQDCHEMWCKQKRKKEREAQKQRNEIAAGNNNNSSSSSNPISENRLQEEAKGTPPVLAQQQVQKDVPPGRPSLGSLSVPLPTAPALNTSILESLPGNAPSTANRQSNLSSSISLLMKSNSHLDELTQITAHIQQLQSNDKTNKDIQQAIYKAKQKQLAILSQLTVAQQAKIAQTLSMAITSQSEQKGVKDTLQQFLNLVKPDAATVPSSTKPPSLLDTKPPPSLLEKPESKSSPIMGRHPYDYDNQVPPSVLPNMQTFDYGNQSNKEFERVAVEQLDWEKHHGSHPTPPQQQSLDYPRRQHNDRYEGWHP